MLLLLMLASLEELILAQTSEVKDGRGWLCYSEASDYVFTAFDRDRLL